MGSSSSPPPEKFWVILYGNDIFDCIYLCIMRVIAGCKVRKLNIFARHSSPPPGDPLQSSPFLGYAYR